MSRLMLSDRSLCNAQENKNISFLIRHMLLGIATCGGGGAVSTPLAMSAVVRVPIRPARAAAGSFWTSSDASVWLCKVRDILRSTFTPGFVLT